MAASKEPSTTKRKNTKVRRSQAPTGGELFPPPIGQDDLGCRNGAPDPRQFEPVGLNAYADASQPGSPRLHQQGAGLDEPSPSSDSDPVSEHENSGADGGQADNPEGEPAEAKRLATGCGEAATTTDPLFRPVMTVRQVADCFQVSRATIWRWQKEAEDFPRSFTVGGNTTRWYRRDIEEYLRRRMAGTPE